MINYHALNVKEILKVMGHMNAEDVIRGIRQMRIMMDVRSVRQGAQGAYRGRIFVLNVR
jgi:hypothetical protein